MLDVPDDDNIFIIQVRGYDMRLLRKQMEQ